MTLFIKNTKQYNILSYIPSKKPLFQVYNSISDCKGVRNISGSQFVMTFSALPSHS